MRKRMDLWLFSHTQRELLEKAHRCTCWAAEEAQCAWRVCPLIHSLRLEKVPQTQPWAETFTKVA